MAPRIPSFRAYGRRSLAERLSVFERMACAFRDQPAVETVHDLRVAARRFHAAALLFGESVTPAALQRTEQRIRRVRKSAGKVRDGDVQQEYLSFLLKKKRTLRYRAGIERLMLRLRQRRERQTERIGTAVREYLRSRCGGTLKRSLRRPLVRRTGPRPAILIVRAHRSIGDALASLLQFEPFVRQPSAAEELHRMRIAAKRFRYVLEIFDPVYGGRLRPFIRSVRTVQDMLGIMHDCDVWLQSVPWFIEQERKRTEEFFGDTASFPRIERGCLYLLDTVRAERMRQYRRFVRHWNMLTREQTWRTLAAVTSPSTSR